MLGERVGKSGAWRFCLPVPSPATGVEFLLGAVFSSCAPVGYDLRRWRRDRMALFDDILSGNWVTGLAIGVGAVIILPLLIGNIGALRMRPDLALRRNQ